MDMDNFHGNWVHASAARSSLEPLRNRVGVGTGMGMGTGIGMDGRVREGCVNVKFSAN